MICGLRISGADPRVGSDISWAVMAAPRAARTLLFRRAAIRNAVGAPAHDPEKWIPVFGKDHAPTRSYRDAA
jgi:hypothetical protein